MGLGLISPATIQVLAKREFFSHFGERVVFSNPFHSRETTTARRNNILKLTAVTTVSRLAGANYGTVPVPGTSYAAG